MPNPDKEFEHAKNNLPGRSPRSGQQEQQDRQRDRIGHQMSQIRVQKRSDRYPDEPGGRARGQSIRFQVQRQNMPNNKNAPDQTDEGNHAIQFFADRVSCHESSAAGAR
jgi:hypothetical protein